jgi:hypothetical protein
MLHVTGQNLPEDACHPDSIRKLQKKKKALSLMIGGVALKNITTFAINLEDHHSKTTPLKNKHFLN